MEATVPESYRPADAKRYLANKRVLMVLDIKVLKDDKRAFPPYQACIVARSDTLSAFPGLKAALSQLSGKTFCAGCARTACERSSAAGIMRIRLSIGVPPFSRH